MLWPSSPAPASVGLVPKLSDEDYQFKQRISEVLKALRASSGWTREEAAEAIGVNAGTLGRWERGEYAPKGYDLGRLYRGYVAWGAQWEWFFDPPAVVRISPVRDQLDALAAAGAIAGDEREARVQARRQQAVARRRASLDKRPTGTRRGSPQ